MEIPEIGKVDIFFKDGDISNPHIDLSKLISVDIKQLKNEQVIGEITIKPTGDVFEIPVITTDQTVKREEYRFSIEASGNMRRVFPKIFDLFNHLFEIANQNIRIHYQCDRGGFMCQDIWEIKLAVLK